MDVWQKKTVRWTRDGKNVPPGTANASKRIILSKRFYGTLRLATGKSKQQPLTEERKTSLTLLRRLQTEQDERRANGVDRYHDERQRPLLEVLDEYESYLRSKGNTALHVQTQTARCRKLLTTTKAKTSDDLDGSRILKMLAIWRTRKAKPLSVQSSNHYLVALKGRALRTPRIEALAEPSVSILGHLDLGSNQAILPQTSTLLPLGHKSEQAGGGEILATDADELQRPQLYVFWNEV